MIKVYIMSTCPDCKNIKRMVADDQRFQVIDIGEHVRNLKEFMQLRDVHPKFEVARKRGLVGIPSFIMEDGTVTFEPKDVGLSEVEKEEITEGTACNLDGSGC